MRLVLNNFIFFLLLVCTPTYSEEIFKSYTVKTSGIKIGKLSWGLTLNNNEYINNLNLKNEGLLSAIYNFKGEYFSKGRVENKVLIPQKYIHLWQTKKSVKKMELLFDENNLTSLIQKPIEEDIMRVDVFNKEGVKDPLTSFLQIIMGQKNSLVVDGRRLYTMTSKINENENKIIIEIKNYHNLWADHKRNDFEKIIFEKQSGSILPVKIFIYFDGRVFRLEED